MAQNPDLKCLNQVIEQQNWGAAIDSSALLVALDCRLMAAEQGSVTLCFTPGPDYVQGGGVVSGGIVATMLDFGLAFAGLTTCEPNQHAASIGLNVQFLKPVLPGQVEVKSWLSSSGYRIGNAQAELRDSAGAILATAQSPLAFKR
jgi:uncharacterized protein (TIGR00369 family)